jgi:hypothetical protein
MKIVNLTQHAASPAQEAEGVVCPHVDSNPFSAALRELLTFDTLPSSQDVADRSAKLAKMARQLADFAGADAAMIGGAPFLMASLEKALGDVGLIAVFAFSTRESVEEVVGGQTVKRSVFAHKGFVGPTDDTQLDRWWNKVCTQTAAGTRGA